MCRAVAGLLSLLAGAACGHYAEIEHQRSTTERSSIEMCEILLRDTRARYTPHDDRPLTRGEWAVAVSGRTLTTVVTGPVQLLGPTGDPVATYRFRCEIPKQGEPDFELTYVPPPPPPPPPAEATATSTRTADET